ncbi:hypothetical protein, variant 1 [Aphanomyces invadans]|uniref:FYVE-type domain-containing protein n=2 Tax=Aphanomyces invadans TaxID=157072 RepID=A0A024TSC3_9STRA|nr:hypothetical protein, variant 1 [Aphanomyces invadans]ETV96531.1 hypothetical protein, variant 1 [Aphanomyces invadans]|eukprot:XP_008874796.1 hypothetical protein, variant 1 [Aphanomyces invadans]
MGRSSNSGRAAGASLPPPTPLLPPHVYYIDAGFLAVGTLLRPDEWVKDECRSHCNICMQQFHAFRRRHHCRTCGEVLCHSCSKHKKVRLIRLNYELGVRICTFCVMQATDATRDVRHRSKSSMVRGLAGHAGEPLGGRILGRQGGKDDNQDLPDVVNEKLSSVSWRLTSQMSMCPAWRTTGESTAAMSKLDCDRLADTSAPDDSTMNVLLHLVANSLFCPMVCIGLVVPSLSSVSASSQFQASYGLPPTLSPSDVCSIVWSKGGNSSVILHDTLNGEATCPPALLAHEIRFFAGVPILVNEVMVGVVVAMDIVPHTQTSLEQHNTLDSVARIAAEVLEERAAFAAGTSHWPKGNSFDELKNTSPVSIAHNARETPPNRSDPDEVAVVNSFDSVTLTPFTSWPASAKRGTLVTTVGNRSRYSNATPYDHAIRTAMVFYRALLRSAWELEREVDGTRLFSLDERYEWGYLKATKVLTVGDGKVDWNKVLDLRQAKVYGDIVASTTKRSLVDMHTTIDVVEFHTAALSRSSSKLPSDKVQLLSHQRQYPGGTWTMLAIDLSDMQFVFAWLVSPHAAGQVLLSVIMPNFAAGLTDILLVRLLAQVQEVTASMGDLRLSACSGSADILETRGMRAYSCSVIPASTSLRDESDGATTRQRSRFWDLLGKTILTQQLLSQQQSSMMQTLNENANKLERLSQAVNRVESLLEAKPLELLHRLHN